MSDLTHRFDTVKDLLPHAPTTKMVQFTTAASGEAAQNDRIALGYLPANCILEDGDISHDGTLGASCTITLQLENGATDIDLTAASTAGGASRVRMTAHPVASTPTHRVVYALVEGAAIAAVANICARWTYRNDTLDFAA